MTDREHPDVLCSTAALIHRDVRHSDALVGYDITISTRNADGTRTVWIEYASDSPISNRTGIEHDTGTWDGEHLVDLNYRGETQQAIEDAIYAAIEDAWRSSVNRAYDRRMYERAIAEEKAYRDSWWRTWLAAWTAIGAQVNIARARPTEPR